MSDTLIGIFLAAVDRFHKPAQFMRKRGGSWESISAERALGDVESFALGLESLGVRAGERVGLLAESRYEWPVADLAALGLGAVVVPVYPTLTAAQVGKILGHADPVVVVVSSEEQLAKLREVQAQLPSLRAIVCMDTMELRAPRERAFADVVATGGERRTAAPRAFRERAAAVRPEDLATIIYTSGTTGEPKGAMLTHHNIAFDLAACYELVTITSEDVSLSFLPLCHVFERMAGLYGMLRGGVTIAYAQSMDTVATDVREVRPTIINGVPRFYEKVHARILARVQEAPAFRQRLFAWGMRHLEQGARAHFERRDERTLAMRLADRLIAHTVREGMGGRLRICISGGAPLSPHTLEFFFALGITVIEGYGLTETSPVICLNPPGREKPGSVGPPIPGVEVKLGEQDEIITRGPHVMRGYFKDETATREALRDGWFHTGDIGRFDDDGYLYITDRLKDLIVLAGGKKVAPQPIETKLKRSPLVGEAVLLGEAKPYIVCLVAPAFERLEAAARAAGWTGETHAQLVASPQAHALIAGEIERVNAELARFETIKGFAILDQELTQENGLITPSLKVKRRVVAERYADVTRALYTGHLAPV